MAEPLNIDPPKPFLDTLRTLALIGGAGLSADARSAPLGQMLTMGGLLIARGQDKAQDQAVQSVLSAYQTGGIDYEGAQRTLADAGRLTPSAMESLQTLVDRKRAEAEFERAERERLQLEPLKQSVIAQLTQRRAVEPAYPEGDAQGPPFLRQPSGPMTAEELRQNIQEFQEKPGALAAYSIAFPGMATMALQERQQRSAEQAAAQKAFTKAQEMAGNEAAARVLQFAYMDKDDPRYSQDEIHKWYQTAVASGYDQSKLDKLVNPGENIRLEVRERLSSMGLDVLTAEPREIQAAIRAVEAAEDEQWKRRQQALTDAQANAKDREIVGASEAIYYVDRDTFEPAPVGIRRGELRRDNYLLMDLPSQRQLRDVQDMRRILKQLRFVVEGGRITDPEIARSLGKKVGDVLEHNVPEDVQGLTGRFEQAGNVMWDVLNQNMTGLRAATYSRLLKMYGNAFARGIGGNKGHTTEQDRELAIGAYPTLLPTLKRLPDTRQQIDFLFTMQDAIANDLERRAYGLNRFKKDNDTIIREQEEKKLEEEQSKSGEMLNALPKPR